jgi:hypothetical protein
MWMGAGQENHAHQEVGMPPSGRGGSIASERDPLPLFALTIPGVTARMNRAWGALMRFSLRGQAPAQRPRFEILPGGGNHAMTTSLSIDRFEGAKKEIAVFVTDDGRSFNLPRWLLPKDAKAGDVVTLTIERDAKATAKVAAQTKSVQADLAKGDDGKDIQL